ncbi:mitochondrial sulfite oxidase [Naviculisporaceae sp. PSN 640]
MATRFPGLSGSLLRQASRSRLGTTTRAIHPCAARPLHTTSLLRTPNPNTSQRTEGSSSNTKSARVAPLSLILGGGILASAIAIVQHHHDEDQHFPSSNHYDTPSPLPSNDNRDPSLPRFRLSSIRAEHGPDSPNPWVTHQDKVYDITDWVAAHPGGDVILRAAGGSIEPYWKIFSIHNSAHVKEILDQYLIGYIDLADLDIDGKPALETIEDPFQADPVRDSRFIVHTDKPRNAEPPNEELLKEFKTPNEMFYIRNHMWVPVVDEKRADEEYALTVELPDGETKRYTLGELKAKFPTHKVTAVLQCSGNRRNDMTRHAGKTNGLQWGVGAIGNAEWEGVRLSDVLVDAGLVVADLRDATKASTSSSNGKGKGGEDARLLHVQLSGLEAYGSSIPLTKALDPTGDVLLAFGMNGKPLPRDHGFPIRAIVPGTVAARSVKWLSKIVIADEESPSQWQRRDYKSFGPNEGANPDWDRAKAIQEMPVTSAITGVWVGECVRKGKAPSWAKKGGSSGVVDVAAVESVIGYSSPRSADRQTSSSETTPCPEQTPPAEPVAIQGYAYSGGGRGIARVDVSLDGGKTWDQAELVDDCSAPPNGESQCYGNKNWSWTRWRYTGQLPVLPIPPPAAAALSTGSDNDNEQDKKKYCTTLVVKATDEAYNAQPETHKGIYNVRGNLATAWHRVRICPSCAAVDGKAGRAGVGVGGVKWSTGETYGCGFGKETTEGGK